MAAADSMWITSQEDRFGSADSTSTMALVTASAVILRLCVGIVQFLLLCLEFFLLIRGDLLLIRHIVGILVCGDHSHQVRPVVPEHLAVSSLAEVLKRFDEVKHQFDIPTQICVLGHITTQIEAVKQGAPCDMIFQSIAGSEKGNRAFGFSAETVDEAQELMRTQGTAAGPNVLYFETGQGSAGTHFSERSFQSTHGRLCKNV